MGKGERREGVWREGRGAVEGDVRVRDRVRGKERGG